MGSWLYLWAFPALWFLLTELFDARSRAWPQIAFAVFGAAAWPISAPFALWVAMRPEAAEKLRQQMLRHLFRPTPSKEK